MNITVFFSNPPLEVLAVFNDETVEHRNELFHFCEKYATVIFTVTKENGQFKMDVTKNGLGSDLNIKKMKRVYNDFVKNRMYQFTDDIIIHSA